MAQRASGPHLCQGCGCTEMGIWPHFVTCEWLQDLHGTWNHVKASLHPISWERLPIAWGQFLILVCSLNFLGAALDGVEVSIWSTHQADLSLEIYFCFWPLKLTSRDPASVQCLRNDQFLSFFGVMVRYWMKTTIQESVQSTGTKYQPASSELRHFAITAVPYCPSTIFLFTVTSISSKDNRIRLIC